MPAAHAISPEVLAIDGENSPRTQCFGGGDERVIGLNLFASCAAFAQSYTVATIAGGALRTAPQASGSIGSPTGITVDAAGNVYFFSLNCIFKLHRKGVLTRIAGNYSRGYSGDGGPAINAQLNDASGFEASNMPTDLGLAVDAAGNVYVLLRVLAARAGRAVAGYGLPLRIRALRLFRLEATEGLIGRQLQLFERRLGNGSHLECQRNGVLGCPAVEDELISAVPAKFARSRFVVRGTTRTDWRTLVSVSLCQITTGRRPICSRGR